MYYDTLLTALPLLLLFASPWGRKFVPCLLLILLVTSCNILIWLDPRYQYQPIDTYLLLGLWAWCGWQTVASTKRGLGKSLRC